LTAKKEARILPVIAVSRDLFGLQLLPLILIWVVAGGRFLFHPVPMRKTSDILWQDAQHQVLFEILDMISEPGTDTKVLNKLQDYTETHFSLEELYMLELGYPGRDAHILAHDKFREEINRLLETDQVHDTQFMEIISVFLTEWLTRHVFGIDKKLEQYILDSAEK
jgi:hemerythrin